MNRNHGSFPACTMLASLAIAGCADMGTARDDCRHTANITINTSGSRIAVAPSNRCAVPGEVIAVKLVPRTQAAGEVRIIAKPGNPDKPQPGNWLNRSNSLVDHIILIEVPDLAYFDEICPGRRGDPCRHAYSVQASGKPQLDPMITVRR